MVWREKKIFGIRTIQLDNLRSLLGMKRVVRILNAEVRVLWCEEEGG